MATSSFAAQNGANDYATAELRRFIHALRRARPRNGFLRVSLLVLGLLVVAVWVTGDFDASDTFSTTRGENFQRFLSDVRPSDLRGKDWDFGVVGSWIGRKLDDGGWAASVNTLAISVLAIVLASLGAFLLSFAAARNFAIPHPFAPAPRTPLPHLHYAWRSVLVLSRGALVLLRSLPEYILAFLILGMLDSVAWPAVLALAIHNAGILGRLNAETIENVEARPLRALRALGASRSQIAVTGIWPAGLPRFLLYFFYRWETCVREATVLGILGLASLGLLIDDAQVAFRYDDMVLFILIGVAIILLGDLLSAIARRIVRRAS